MAETIIQNEQIDAQKRDEELLKKLRSWAAGERSKRTRQEVIWYEIELLKDGNHYKFVDQNIRDTGSAIRVQPIIRRKGEIQRTYNKFRSLFRAIKATTTATEIRWDVPGGSQEEIIGSNYLNWFRDKDKVNPFSQIVGEVVGLGFLRSVAFFDPYWDSEKAMPVIAARDPFDLLLDSYGKYARRTYTQRIEDIKIAKTPEGELIYKNTENLKPTNKKSDSEIYDNYLSAKYSKEGYSNNELADVMLEEFHILEYKTPEKKEINESIEQAEEKAGTQVRIITTSQENTNIHNEETYDDSELRFIPYQPEKRAGDLYNEPWMRDAIDPQRTLDNLYTHFEEFIRTMGKGRIMKRKGQNLDRISDKDGQIFDFEGEKPDFVPPVSLTGDQFNFKEMVELAMEDLIGIHPSQIRKTETARGIGYLIALDETNVSEPFKNLQASLVKVGHRLLRLANRHLMSSQDIFWWQNGEKVTARVISPNAQNIPENIFLLSDPDDLTVELVPRGPFASLTREEKINNLVARGIITSPEVAMEGQNIGNVRELVEKEMKFRAEQATKEQPEVITETGEEAGQPEEGALKEIAKEAVENLEKQLST